MLKAMDDLRAVQDVGSAILIKGSDGKYALFLPCTNIPATGSAPDQVESTVTTSRVKTYIQGRKDNPQKELTFFAHRDNFMKLKAVYNEVHDFLQVNPDMTAWAYTGKVSFFQDETSVNNNMTAKAIITVMSAEETPRDDVSDVIEDIITFPETIPSEITVKVGGTATFKVVTDPSTATATVTSGTTTVATAAISSGTVTVTPVATGTSILKIEATATGYASNFTTVLVNVVAA